MKSRFALILLLALAPCALAAPAPEIAAEEPQEQVYISLAGVTLNALALYISDFTGKPVLLPDRFPGDRAVEIISGSNAPVPRSRAIEILATALRGAGYAIIEKPGYIQVVPEGTVDGVPVRDTVPAAGLAAQTVLTTVVEIKNADANKLLPILVNLKSKSGNVQVYPDSNKLVITEQAPQLQAMLDLVRHLDTRWAGNVSEIYKLQNASVEALYSIVDAYTRNLAKNAGPLIQKRLEAFSVTSHAPTNSFVLFGYPDDLANVKTFIRSLDVSSVEGARSYHTYFVLNRDVTELVQVLTGVFTAGKARMAAEGGEPAPQVISDPVNSAIIIIASSDKFAEVLPLIKELDKAKAQVLIESALVELSVDKLLDLGVELASLDGPSDDPRGFAATTFGMSTLTTEGRIPLVPSAGGLTAGIFKDRALNIAALLRLSQSDDDVAFIAAPRLMASDNKPAVVKIAEEREYQKSIVTPEGRTSEVTHGGFLTASITLEIVPHINEEGTVRLEIKQVTEQFLPSTETETGPLTNKTSREAQTEVNVPEGCTVVIAGLTRTVQAKRVSQVPYLGRIPLVGFFFRRTTTTNEQRNLCIFITPHILRTREDLAARAQADKDYLNQKMEEECFTLPGEIVDRVTGNICIPEKVAPK